MGRFAILGTTVLAVAICGLWLGTRSLRQVETKPARYEVVDRGDVVIKVTEVGTIEPVKKVEVKSKIAGRIARLLVQEGERVVTGQLLAEIDPTEINSQVAQFQAQLEGARARYEQAKRAVLLSKDQTRANIRQYEEAVRAAEARLKAVQEEERAQPNLTESDIAQAEANFKAAQENWELLKRSTHPQTVVQARSGYDEAKAGAEKARRELERQKRLLSRGFVSQQVLDAAEAEYSSAMARLEQARHRLEQIEEQNRLELQYAESRVAEAKAAWERSCAGRSLIAIKRQAVHTAQAELEQARAQLRAARNGIMQDRMRQDEVEQARANVRQLENQLQEVRVRQHDTILVAPMSGIVTRRYFEEGELVTSGVSTFSSGMPVFQIADLSRMLVRLAVNEVDIHKIRPGQLVEITIDGAKSQVLPGHVNRVSTSSLDSRPPGGETQTSSPQPSAGGLIRFAVEVAIDRSNPLLKPGMSARCTIIVARKRNVLRLPTSCIEGDGKSVRCEVFSAEPHASSVAEEEKGRRGDVYQSFIRTVVVGLRGDTHVEIVSGLKEGDRVLPAAFTGPPRRTLEVEEL